MAKLNSFIDGPDLLYDPAQNSPDFLLHNDGWPFVEPGDLVFIRKKYDVSWDSPMKDRILSKDITLKIVLIGS